MTTDLRRFVLSRRGFRVPPQDVVECAMLALSRVARFRQRVWTISKPPQINPTLANSVHFQAIAAYRFSTYHAGTVLGTPTALGGEHNGTLSLNCVVYAAQPGVHAYQLEFTNRDYMFPEAYLGFEPLILATVIHLAQTLRNAGLLTEKTFPHSQNAVEPAHAILDALGNIGAAFDMRVDEWRKPIIRTALGTAPQDWVWDQTFAALVVALQTYSLGF